MTLCERITNPITRMVEQEGKDLDEIAKEVCPEVKYGREKIIRVIKDFLGEEYLIQHAEVLKYDIEKARLAKKRIRSSIQGHKKIDATAQSNASKSTQGKSAKHGNTGACSQQCDKEPEQCDSQGDKQDCGNHSESEIDHKNEQIPQQHPIQPTKLSFDDVVGRLIELIELSSLNTVKSAIEAIEHDEGLMAPASIKPT